MIEADFAKYESFEQSITEHARFFLRNRRYARALQFKNDPDAFAREIHKAGYATDPNYADKLIKYMRDYKLYRFDQPLTTNYGDESSRSSQRQGESRI
jgi:flagellum-specific peptidoglycan hydrolase FlgJ